MAVVETLQALTDRAGQLKQAGRLAEAIEVYAAAAQHYPQSGVAQHNLAGALGDAGRHAEAETHARAAQKKGLDAPETWMVLARALQGQMHRDDEALVAYEAALSRRPLLLDGQFEWAQLVWMRTGDAGAALQQIDRALAAQPEQAGLHFIRARILEFTVGSAAAYACLAAAIARRPNDLGLIIPAVTQATQAGETEAALRLARHAQSLAPDEPGVMEVLAYAHLAAGDAAEAARVAGVLRRIKPLDQHAVAIQSTAWRLLGDDRHRELFDYDRFVRPYTIDTPPGWSGLDAYLADLTAALKRVHPYVTHPFGQSVRHGSQKPNVLDSDDPAIRAFPQAIDGPIRRHLEHLGRGDDPVRQRNAGSWKLDGIWSVWLRPGGFHTDHVHPHGWLSSACYIELPPAVSAGGQEGWIKFGEPGVPTQPKLGPEHAVRPSPGTLVLFPAYMWHGTIPFSGDEPRLTMAMDIVPG